MGATKKRECCCDKPCVEGGLLPYWENLTKVRPQGDCVNSSPTYDTAPYPRYHNSNTDECSGVVPCGKCGGWLFVADKNGFPIQCMGVPDEHCVTADDIQACAADDIDHYESDHNCYHRNGTVDTTHARFGGKWCLAKKQWHGRFGPVSACDPNRTTGMNAFDAGLCETHNGFTSQIQTWQSSAPQTRYLYAAITAEMTVWLTYTHADVWKYSNMSATSEINATSGIETRGGTYTTEYASLVTLAETAFCLVAANTLNGWADYFWGFKTPDEIALMPEAYYAYEDGVYRLWHGDSTGGGDGLPNYLMEEISWNPSGGTFYRKKYRYYSGGATRRTITETCTVSDGGATFTSAVDSTVAIDDGLHDFYTTATLTLDTPYTSADCCGHVMTALRAFNLADSLIYPWRTDEKLALAPLCVYDETSAKQPLLTYQDDDGIHPAHLTMPDYAGTIDGETWPTRGWLDPDSYVWEFSGYRGYSPPDGFTGGATLRTNLRTGEIISHNVAGTDKHFWFNYLEYDRLDATHGREWFPISWGAYTPDDIPKVSMRWMDRDEAQYDPASYRGDLDDDYSGNYPQSFIKQKDAQVVAGKYVEATQHWPSVNYGYPCGAAKYDVDQLSVCEVLSVDGTTLTIRKTCNATTMPGVGAHILYEGYGICTVSSVTATTDGTDGDNTWSQWIMVVSVPIESVPAGRSCLPNGLDGSGIYRGAGDGNFLGSLRWYTAPACDSSNDETPKHTGVRMEWTFNNRMAHAATGDQPAWIGGSGAGTGTGIVGCTSLTLTQFSYPNKLCPAVVGFVPYYSKYEGGTAPDDYFVPSALAPMPATISFDSYYGALWLGAFEMTMPDPFWQEPFKPFNPDAIDEAIIGCNYSWVEDNGSGQADTDTVKHYPHHRMVEASSMIPAGKSLPSGIELYYDGAIVSPPYYVISSGGLPIGDASGNYGSFERPWGFTGRACVAGGYHSYYATFTTCP